MDKHVDLLFEAECQAGYLADTVTTLRIVADALFAGLTAWKKVATTSDIADWALECSGGFYVVIRDLERIHDDLDAAVTQKYHEKVELVPVGDLVPYERNPRTHPPEQIRALQASIREYGFVSPLLIDTQRRVIAGHGRLLAAKALEMEAVPCVYAEHLTDEQRRAYILADNRLAEMSGWDDALVEVNLEELRDAGIDISLTGFTLDELPAEGPVEPEEKPESSTRSEKTVTCPSCGCEFRPSKRKK